MRIRQSTARGLLLTAGLVVAILTMPAIAIADTVVIPGNQWLQGQGVDVYKERQCVELPQSRLYPKFGWPRVYAAGNGGAACIPEGSPGLIRHNPGSGYVPVPGDLIIENPYGVNVPYGHVAVVDYTEGNTIHAVQQNSPNARHDYAYNGSSYAGGYGSVKCVMHAPQNGFTNPGSNPVEGSFVQVSGSPEVYRIAGGAPLYVSNWSAFGGAQPVAVISQSRFSSLRTVPANGTLINSTATGRVYIIAGGAPLYVSNWAAIGGARPVVSIDQWCIDNISHPLAHMRARPADGTLVGSSADGCVYVIAGGAPLYVSNWAAIGGARPVVAIDQWCIDNWRDPHAHLNNRPADGTLVGSSADGRVYIIAGGAPLYVSNFAAIGGARAVVGIDQWCIDNWRDPHAHLNAVPADGTFLNTSAGRVYRVAGGCGTCQPE
jgi:hypothetical protein